MIIRRASLAAALPVTLVAAFKSRYGNIRCAPGVTEATDGHIAVRLTDRAPFPSAEFPLVPDTTPHDAPVLVPIDAAKSAIKAMPKKTTLPILASAYVGKTLPSGQVPEAITLTTTDLAARSTYTIDTADQSFLDLNRVIPTFTTDAAIDCVKVCLSVEVLETLLKAVKASEPTGATPTVTIALRLPDAPTDDANHARIVDDAITAEWRGEDIDGFAVIMPCRM